ncbi:Disease resistance protein RGA2 [Camellia lanceoleosa]|uniref:Disease resistance protein RGA2 n=1 Tax=Camellia lanceoleosa TaxID=1840588 RepID=A0ACC0IM11_9ERIC|nr:Disease resistance protein RGA2 [Camellia lanceoleosa]
MSDLLLQIVIDKLASPLLEKLNDLCSLKENIGKLRQSLPLVLAFLEDAEKRQETEKTIEVWLLELKNVAYESEDLLDELTAEIMLCENHSRISDKVRNLLPFEPSRHLFDLAKELRNKLKELPAKGSTSQGLKYGKNNGSPGSSCSNSFWDSGIEAKDILECLEPHPNLRKLFIKGYPGNKFPSWVLPNLVQVVLINFRRCENLPTLGQLPFLKTICLQGMDGVVCIAEEFYGSDSQTLFPSLKELKLRDFPNLEQWSSIDDRQAFPCLDKLIVDGCPNLRKMPVFPSLQRLELRNCHPKIMNSIKDVTSLSILVIDSFPNLLHLPGELLENNTRLTSFEVRKCQNLRSLPSELGSLTALKSLIISHCENLTHLSPSLQNLKALEFLEINDCHGMKTLREDVIGGLSSLRTLVIENCNNLISLSNGLRFLTALERLSIMSCPKLAFLPNGLQNLSTLQSLSILSCPELFSLPEELQHVTTLQSLVIHSCPGLTILPDWVGNFSSLRSLSISNCHYLTSLPAGLQHLSKLQHLSIQDCPLLERLCKQKKGKNWRNIVHIPHIYVGSLKLGK